MTETQWDKLLRIKTTGRDDTHADQYRYPYEPTPYVVLERLAESGYVTRKNLLVDYGAGKGRVGFFLSYQTRCRYVGIEYDERICQTAWKNKEAAVSASRIELLHCRAEDYEVPESADRLYFFNPFSVEILQKVFGKIRRSWYQKPREILLLFYYPSGEYMAFLMAQEELMFFDEIDCRDLFDQGNEREKIVIFRMMT